MAIGMYNRPMTEEEERMMMSQSLRGNNNMMMADANMIGPGVMTDADAAMLNERSRGAELIPPGADMSQFNDVTGTGVIGSGVMTENEANMLRNNVSPMGTPMTPEQIDEEIMRLQILKNQMMMGN
tara:strand:+ start:144 stop:521 length:378 start_codon:yes stop_codon:yes gene_type:complete